jgi:hypothetical protein
MPSKWADRDRWPTTAALCAAIIVAWLIYQPNAARPFDMRDFSEFVPLLKGDNGVLSQFRKLTDYYATRGRANLIPYAAIVVKWKVFGWSSVWWQLLRFAQMCVVVVTAFAVLRRLGADRAGAALGASLFIIGGSAAHGWVRLTMAEVVGTQLLLAALLIALRFQRASTYWPHVLGISAIAATLVLAKEMFVSTIPLPVAFALCWGPDDTLRLPRWTRRDIELVAATTFATLATVVPVGLVALNAPAGAYTSTFGTEGIPWFRPVVWIAGAATPYLVIGWRSPTWALVQLLVYGSLLFIGLKRLLQDRARATHYRFLLTLLGLHVVAGALLYLPWPVYQPFYAMPFLIAPAAAAGLAATGMRGVAVSKPLMTTGLTAAWVVVLGSATLQALDYRRATDAEQRFNAELVEFLAAPNQPIDSVVVVNKRPLRGARAWQGFGAMIARYGEALSLDLPPVQDEDCQTARRRRTTSGAATLVLRNGNTCESMARPDTVIVRHYVRFDWDRLRTANDSLFAEMYRGLAPAAP